MKNNKKLEKAFILLDDGTIFFGKALGVKGSAFGELCFNTDMLSRNFYRSLVLWSAYGDY